MVRDGGDIEAEPMTSTQQGPSGWSPADSVGEPSGTDRGMGWWPQRPRRSVADRKIAGVAGGLGRAMGVDPVLFRVGFVVLGFFGIGIPLYLAGWLLLPGDEDQVSPGEALLGRGRSSVPPIAVVAIIVGLAVSLGMTFSFGNVFPLIALAVIAVLVLRRRHRGPDGWSCGRGPRDQHWAGQWQRQGSWPGSGHGWSDSAQQWAASQPWGRAAGFTGTSGAGPTDPDGPARTSPVSSPFDTPPFWDEPSSTGDRVDLTKRAAAGPSESGDAERPPAWDPLGVAPFAWDLPEPSPTPPPPVPVTRDRGVIGRVTTGVALLVGGTLAAGILAGWWSLPWAAVSGGALAVVAVGLLVGSLRGRAQNLIGTGIFLSLVTLGLTVTGLQGTGGYGDQKWTPASVAAVQSHYEVNGGAGTLDLTGVTVPAGQTVRTDVEVHAGQASVVLPADATVDVTCTSNAGEVDCLGERRSGLRQQVDQVQAGSSDRGTIELTVHVGAGQAEVRRG